ncbi:MAG: hypothetical protein WDZ38_06065 [Balneolaceae bacterium]
MSKEIDSYKLGDIRVVITETDDPKRYLVDCNDGHFHSEFKVRVYEYENYKRHMNQTITKAYNKQHEEDSGNGETGSTE